MMAMRRKISAAVFFATLSLACAAGAVEPDEMLSDPALEARARDISGGLRCVVCRNQTIDDSNAPLARDLRILLRERLVAGDSDPQAVAFLVDRYGPYILLKPPLESATLILWLGPALMLLAAVGGFAFLWKRRPAAPNPMPGFCDEDRALLATILDREEST